MKRILFVGLAAAVSLPACAWDCDHEATREGAIDVGGASRVEIVAKAGTLAVRGRQGATQVTARGQACTSRRSYLEDVQIETERRGDTVRILARVPETSGWNQGAKLDLEVDVPANLPIEVIDSSGALSVESVASLRVEDSSGAIRVEDVAGDLDIEDSSGGIEVRNAKGNVRLEDSSGDLRLTGIGGSVDIKEDSSGGIYIEDVTGDVLVRRDSSGVIDVASIGGDFIVERDGSGGVRHRDVGGRVQVPSD
ncbi:MAG: hypothetical protein AAGN66_19670 [Acidobacteriota bacterium]